MYKKTANIFAPSGSEILMGEFIKEHLSGIFESITVDNIGNVICTLGDGYLCVECGMDSLGIMITDIDGQRAHFAGVGGINAEYLVGKKIVFKDGIFGIVRYDGKNSADAKISDLYLEGNFDTLKIGDFGVVDTAFCENETHIFGNGIANRVGLWVAIEALKRAKNLKNLTVLFSAQKRIGAKGIQAFFAQKSFEKVVTVDSIEESGIIKCGEGAFFVTADKSGVCKGDLNEKAKAISAESKNIKIAVTDHDLGMGRISALGKGPSMGAIAVPTREKGKTFEAVQKSDIEDAAILLKKLIEEL